MVTTMAGESTSMLAIIESPNQDFMTLVMGNKDLVSPNIFETKLSTRHKAAFLLIQSRLKQAYKKKNYREIYHIFSEYSIEEYNDNFQNSFAGWLIKELEGAKESLLTIGKRYDTEKKGWFEDYRKEQDSLKEDIKEITKIICSREFEELFPSLNTEVGENLLIHFISSNSDANAYYSHTRGIDNLIHNCDISEFNADRIVEALIETQAEAADTHATSPIAFGGRIDEEQRIMETRIILNSSIGEKFDRQKATMKSIEPISYFLHFLIRNYFEEIDWDEVMVKVTELINSDEDTEEDSFGYDYSDTNMGQDILEFIAKGPEDLGRFDLK